jgi:hypothetical protein
LEKINIWAIILGLVIILQLFPAYWKKMPGLSRTLSVSKDFPGLDFFKQIQGLSRTLMKTWSPIIIFAVHPFDDYVTHTFWSWSLALISKLRKVIGSRFTRARLAGQMTSLSKGCTECELRLSKTRNETKRAF